MPFARTSTVVIGLITENWLASDECFNEFRAALVAINRNSWSRSSECAITTLTVLPSADTATMLFWASLASGQIAMRKVDGWQNPGLADI